VNAAQSRAQAAGRQELVFVEAERILLDAVDLCLCADRDGTAVERFDALIARGRELQLQPQDVVELLEWKGLSAVRAGRVSDGAAFLEEAREAARGTIAFDRVQRRLDSLSAASTTASPTNGPQARRANG
jgi:hypothetical protein